VRKKCHVLFEWPLTCNPSDVCDASENVVRVVVVEDVTLGEGRVQEVAGCAVSYALGGAGAA